MSHGITWYGHQVMTGISILANPTLAHTTYDPLSKATGEEAADRSTWIGYQHLYQSETPDKSQLQVVFLNEHYPGLTLDNKLLQGKAPLSKDQLTEQVVAHFEAHPDPVVKGYIEELIAFYQDEEGVDIRVVPWEEELYSLQTDNEFAGATGLFFPIVHIHITDLNWDIIARCHPVLGVGKENN